MFMRSLIFSLAMIIGATSAAAQKYNGPRPPKPDMVYLMHADNLIPTDVADAKQETKKNETTYTIPGTAATARTPLAEPIFIVEADKLQPEKLELYKLDVKNGHREVSTAQKRSRGGPRPIRLSVTRLDKGLYKIEASETLENGQYSLSPADSNRVFCFEVY
jgi:hypothetical protein